MGACAVNMVWVQGATGVRFEIACKETSTVSQIKEQIEIQEKIPRNMITLKHVDEVLQDDCAIFAYKYENGSPSKLVDKTSMKTGYGLDPQLTELTYELRVPDE